MNKDYLLALEKATATFLTGLLYDEGYTAHVNEIDKEALLQVLRNPFIVESISKNEGWFSENLLHEIYREYTKLVDSKKGLSFGETDNRLNDLEAKIHTISRQQAEIMDFLNRMSKDLDKVEKKLHCLETERGTGLIEEVDAKEKQKENNRKWIFTWDTPAKETTWGTIEINSDVIWFDK